MQIRSLSKKDNELLTRIDEVLHYLWDPIGVRGVPPARDEYESYMGHIFTLLKQNASVPQISNHLRELRVVNMGAGRPDYSLSEDEIAEILMDWKETLFPV